MIVSNEPGLYRTGEYGIRFENLVVVEEDRKTDFGMFLRFRTLTLAPIDRRLIVPEMLDRVEREWIDAYHQRVLTELEPLVRRSGKPEDTAWLAEACRPLTAAG